MDFEKLKEVLQNFLNPEAEEETDEVIEEPTTPGNDLPWKDEETTITPKASNYKLKETKPSKADKFDALFEDED
jgi:hypothetical protein